MNHREYLVAHQRYVALRGQEQTKPSDLENAAQLLMDAFLLEIRPELWKIYFDSRGLFHIVVGIGEDNQPFYLGPYNTIEEMRGAYQSQIDIFSYKREIQIGSLIEKGMDVVYNWIASLFTREAA